MSQPELFVLGIVSFLVICLYFYLLHGSKKEKLQKVEILQQNTPTESTSFRSFRKEKKKNTVYDSIITGKWKKDKIQELDEYRSLYNLLIEKKVKDITYRDLLDRFEWQFTRLQVLVRDGYACKGCGIVDQRNHVHHTYYLKDKLPWDIRMDALETLCRNCHELAHKENRIKVYKENGDKLETTGITSNYCYRCYSTGYLPQYKHRDDGICYACWGECVDKTIFSVPLTLINKDRTNYNTHEKREAYRKFIEETDPTHFIKKLPNFPYNLS